MSGVRVQNVYRRFQVLYKESVHICHRFSQIVLQIEEKNFLGLLFSFESFNDSMK